jgi:hypothetical protein
MLIGKISTKIQLKLRGRAGQDEREKEAFRMIFEDGEWKVY